MYFTASYCNLLTFFGGLISDKIGELFFVKVDKMIKNSLLLPLT